MPEKNKFYRDGRWIGAPEAGGKCTLWDCIWFGSYPQAEIVPSRESLDLILPDYPAFQPGDYIIDKPDLSG